MNHKPEISSAPQGREDAVEKTVMERVADFAAEIAVKASMHPSGTTNLEVIARDLERPILDFCVATLRRHLDLYPRPQEGDGWKEAWEAGREAAAKEMDEWAQTATAVNSSADTTAAYKSAALAIRALSAPAQSKVGE